VSRAVAGPRWTDPAPPAVTRRRWCAGLLAAGASVAAPPRARGDEPSAYARLLARHVRPVTIAGIRLAGVDYAALRADPDYARALEDLARAAPEALRSAAEALAFWTNAYNLLAIKAVVDRYPLASIRDGGTLLRPIWKRPVGTVGGREYALDDVEHGILRARYREPRIHVAVVCASLSRPDLPTEPFVASRLAAQLDDAARRFLDNPTKGVQPGADGRTARVSSIFRWFAEDFGGPEGVVRFLRAHAGPVLAPRLAGLEARGLSYLDYDWSLNDARRAGG
jgi:hypothetical protein